MRVERFAHLLPERESFTSQGQGLIAVSPDGSSLAYVANGAIYLRPFDRVEARPISGTTGALTNPFFSADGRQSGSAT